MKQSKWFKWQVGMIASVTAAFLFHEVKASPAFAQATTAANNGTTDTKVTADAGSQDDMDRWASQIVSGNSETSGVSGSTDLSSSNQQSDLSDRESSSSSSSSQTFSHSRTGRS
ncbi:hypothetical protein [Paenibacillus aestuarii]|uniref:Uncharacterized protein n=1 Tax=Paenibacillus aestuarii TaxID=516965 RepID=A0ABW0K7F6_9BACL|nr:hypothetical protein [Paenibacillus aestuarii]